MLFFIYIIIADEGFQDPVGYLGVLFKLGEERVGVGMVC
jgi:hypothetical protein